MQFEEINFMTLTMNLYFKPKCKYLHDNLEQ